MRPWLVAEHRKTRQVVGELLADYLDRRDHADGVARVRRKRKAMTKRAQRTATP